MRRLLAFSFLLGGCGSVAADAQLRDLRTRLDGAERSRLEMAKKVDELENRVFLLTDQVESQKVELTRREAPPARLPIVTLRPAAPPPDEAPSDVAPEASDAAPASAPIVLEQPPAPRPVARAEGRTRPRPRPAPPTSSAPSHVAADTGEVPNLGVVRLPDRGVPLAHDAHETPTSIHDGEDHAPPPAEPLALYRAASEQLKQGRYDEAAQKFADFVRRYPHHDYADNAQYWLGETYYARKDYAQAVPEFQQVVKRWPTGNKAPDALLKLGFCLLSQGQTDEGRTVLGQLLREYPRTEAAQLAERRLAELPRAEVNP